MAAAMFAIVQRDEIRRNQRGRQFRRLRPQNGDARILVVFRLECRTARLDVRHAEQRGFQRVTFTGLHDFTMDGITPSGIRPFVPAGKSCEIETDAR